MIGQDDNPFHNWGLELVQKNGRRRIKLIGPGGDRLSRHRLRKARIGV